MKREFDLINVDGVVVESGAEFDSLNDAMNAYYQLHPEGVPEGWEIVDVTQKYIDRYLDAIKKLQPSFKRSQINIDWANSDHSRNDFYTVVPFTYQGKHYLYREHINEGWIEKQLPVINGKNFNKTPELINREPLEIRLSRAADPESPVGVLRELSKDRFWYVRDFVARNKNAPKDCLEELKKDSDFRIREDAEKTLTKIRHSSLEDKISEAESMSLDRSLDDKGKVHDFEVERV